MPESPSAKFITLLAEHLRSNGYTVHTHLSADAIDAKPYISLTLESQSQPWPPLHHWQASISLSFVHQKHSFDEYHKLINTLHSFPIPAGTDYFNIDSITHDTTDDMDAITTLSLTTITNTPLL